MDKRIIEVLCCHECSVPSESVRHASRKTMTLTQSRSNGAMSCSFRHHGSGMPIALQWQLGLCDLALGSAGRFTERMTDLAHLTQRSELDVAYTLDRFLHSGYIEPLEENLSQ